MEGQTIIYPDNYLIALSETKIVIRIPENIPKHTEGNATGDFVYFILGPLGNHVEFFPMHIRFR
ncbi:hypothetical protein EL17_13705 [Anditalea andensis]|uniref:Uncharacterized protein n=1 Tax=Anditalea andensis TaxID=1048983 RepID=A0A074LHW9_9BACT|nr:hypothetical protein EL17_13705 [Anditalea andensis]